MWSGLPSISESGAHYHLTVRSDRPIEGCELLPNAFLQLKGGINWDNSMRQRALDANPFSYVFTWHRSGATRMCSNSASCPRSNSFDPTNWSKTALGGPHIMCNVCYRAGRPAHKCSFCSLSCFKSAWKEHASQHRGLTAQRRLSYGSISPSMGGISAPELSGRQTDAVALNASEAEAEEAVFPVPVVSTATTVTAASVAAAASTATQERGIAFNSSEQRSRSNTMSSANSNSFFNAEGDEVDDDGEKWTLISQDRRYLPQAADVGCRLRVAVRAIANNNSNSNGDSNSSSINNGISNSSGAILAGPVFAFTAPVLSAPAAPPKRSFQTITTAPAGALQFRLVSYNILAEQYATTQAYPYCDTWALGWSYRLRLLLQELDQLQSDIVCLQEVQADHYEQHLLPAMQQRGYDAIYKAKSRDYAGQYGKVDGCAIFWKHSKFAMAENYSIEFNSIARNEIEELALEDAEARRFMTRLSRDNIAQIVVLEPLQHSAASTGAAAASSGNICVVNTHLYSNHQRGDVKLWQTLSLLREVRQFIAPRQLPLLLCGDFNSEPTSAVYELLLHGMISDCHPELDAAENGGGVRVLPDWHRIMHDIALASAMGAASDCGNEPLFTNYTSRFKSTLDYVFFSPSRFQVLAVNKFPEEADLQSSSGEGLPSACYPSDHLSLCCDIAMTGAPGTGSILNLNHPGLEYAQHHQQQQQQHQQQHQQQRNRRWEPQSP